MLDRRIDNYGTKVVAGINSALLAGSGLFNNAAAIRLFRGNPAVWHTLGGW